MVSETRKKPGPKPKPVPAEKQCIKCAEIKPFSDFPPRRNACRICANKQHNAYYASHKDLWKKETDREKKRQACRKWYAKPSTQEYVKAYRKQRYEANKEANNAQSREYKKKHKDRLSFVKHKYRAQKHGVLGTATYDEWLALCDHYQNRCLCCGEQKPLTVDHVIAMVLGGTHTIDNIQPLCKECHLKKHVRMTDYRPAVQKR